MRKSSRSRNGAGLSMMLTIMLVILLMILLALAGSIGIGAARAQTANADPNIDPILPDPVPDGHLFPPAMATAGTGDPGRELRVSPVPAAMLAGRGRGCVSTSPCAVNSPPVMTLTPVDRSK